MDKKEMIMDVYEQLMIEGLDKTISISGIAKKANIAKGALYYYFKNKEDLLDQVVERHFGKIIFNCQQDLKKFQGNSIDKVKRLFQVYTSQTLDQTISKALHEPENGYLHQKSQIFILEKLSVVLADIIVEGNHQLEFNCQYPLESAQIVLSSIIFLLDPGLFNWNQDEFQKRFSMTVRTLEALCQIDPYTIKIDF